MGLKRQRAAPHDCRVQPLAVSTKYRCHFLCHFEMSLSAELETTPVVSERGAARSARRKAQPTLKRRASR